MKLIVGLGNPGKEYEYTRHNAGFIFIDHFIEYFGYDEKISKFEGICYIKRIGNEKILFLKPQTYMNLSGKCIVSYMNFYKIDRKDILIVYDDKDLNITQLKWKIKGSSGGHNGIKDILTHFKNIDIFKRLRVGIGKPPKEIPIIKWVLSRFTKDEIETLILNAEFSINGINDFINDVQFSKIMSQYSKN